MDKSYLYKVIAVICLGWVMIYADRTALYPMLSVIGQKFDLTATQTGAITSTYFLLYVAMQIPAGLLGDRIGLKRVLVATYFLAGLGMLAIGLLAASYPTLLLFVAIHGLGGGAHFPTAYGLAMINMPSRLRGLGAAIINSGMALGTALGLAAAGPVYLLTQEWRTPFLLLALPTLLIALLYALILREIRPTSLTPGRFQQLLRNRNVVSICLANFCSLYGFWTILVWGPTFFQTERGIGLETAGLYTAIVAMAALPAGLVSGGLSDRLGRRLLSLILFPLATMMIISVAFVHSLTVMILALIGYGLFGKLSWDPIGASWLSDHVAAINPDDLGSALGLYSFAGMSSAIITPVIAGWIKDMSGSFERAFYLGAGIVLLGFFLTLLPTETAGVKRPLATPAELGFQ
ncbi:MAG: MFS transporter [Chloroflexi bacterium]|nr:MFS transporter [Chloroflexota bacterium]MCL5074122.1 MFS transporter [Chloroflexota bacterium]